MSQLFQQGLLLAARQAAGDGAAPPVELPDQSLDLSSYPTSSLQQFGFFIIFFFPAVSAVLVALRLYGRITMEAVGVDDFFIIAATVCG